ncbi:MAG TPA: arginine--tRNA ligase [Candidatus Vogelbacteria bacterium]|uniref:Arginine--tRNA ligase n=1 Tax=Candidatus Vogelbacteria bacterium RIFOXYD1_FULL_51_18 TaxID=1802440 RepID=A0A1G2QIP5_9BACT|nr:MAG: hypothetical protein UY66_C0023G0006 [Parcubacteria group bacterium GW2011_GWC1_51_35]KKW25170.1 MAG: Arginine-tRNA ligase [Parcubacteria group bacterium GW2011_GWF2_52_12]KKW34621.1 MAG: Arginine-tRNA ligase [Parcubacteria group bacterium GW2011_GWB1_53_43]KKW38554.1 MAG: Arginine-tRNA ligase [Parcubacteria group bacterium GW2011_GWA1_54_88]OHA60307.1 MAG: arginine--tRNA ligase [Candidatus Vogelbacteria bacterium RIFOXYD1_FULL_51_18]HBB65327.1 arginine--tRNA ligase [Candidatus Vogelba
MEKEIRRAVQEAAKGLGYPELVFTVDPVKLADSSRGRGDYAANVAFGLSKITGKSALEIAGALVTELNAHKSTDIEHVEVGGNGFINFFLAPVVFHRAITEAAQNPDYGRSTAYAGKKVMVEYTDTNPFKLFHIGHLMSNCIGESLSRLIEWGGAEVKRADYQGDVGLHVAKALWKLVRQPADGDWKLEDGTMTMEMLGRAYAAGATAYESDEQAKKEIHEINKKIYERSDPALNELYDAGRKISLDYFESIHTLLGTHFDYYFFESETGEFGKKIVSEHMGTVFEESEGAVIYRGEKKGLHTRVFLNKDDLPTYEAKELGLAKIKYERYPYDLSVVVTGNEISEYFKVLLAAMGEIFPELAAKQKHVPHGMLRLPSGKMSSRTGDVLTAEWLIGEVREKIRARAAAAEEKKDVEGTLDAVSVAALKYSILKQGIGRDSIFDVEKSISFTGDSGPYLQYSHARAGSVLAQPRTSAAADAGQGGGIGNPETPGALERLIFYFPEEAERAAGELAPQRLVAYANELAGAFNSYYAENRIIGSEREAYRLALTAALRAVLSRTLSLLGMAAPEKM